MLRHGHNVLEDNLILGLRNFIELSWCSGRIGVKSKWNPRQSNFMIHGQAMRLGVEAFGLVTVTGLIGKATAKDISEGKMRKKTYVYT